MRTKVTLGGWFLFVVGISLLGSAFKATRLAFGGMMVHPYLFLIVPVGLCVIATRYPRIPRRLLTRTFVFMAIIFGMTIPGVWTISVATRVAAWLFTAIVCFLLTSTRGDYYAGVAGMVIGVGLMGWHGLAEVAEAGIVTAYGVNPLQEVAAKNAFSLYAAPAVFLALGTFILPKARLWLRMVFVGFSAVILIVVFGSANRSGWVTMLVIPVVLMAGRVKVKVILLTVVLSSVVFVAMERLQLTKVFSDRMELTQAGYSSDDLRMEIYQEGLMIFLENPLVGALPWNVNFELAKRTAVPFRQLGTHSIVILMIAGFGLLGTVPLLMMAAEFFRVGGVDFRGGLRGLLRNPPAQLAVGLASLWLVRGFFTDEVLWAPCFAIGFGLVLAMAMIERKSERNLTRVAAAGPPPTLPPFRGHGVRFPTSGGGGSAPGTRPSRIATAWNAVQREPVATSRPAAGAREGRTRS